MDVVCDKKQFPFIFAALECLEKQCQFELRSLQEPSAAAAVGVMVVRESNRGEAAVKTALVRQVEDLARVGAVRHVVVVVDCIKDTVPEGMEEFVKSAINDNIQTFFLCLDNQLARLIGESLNL